MNGMSSWYDVRKTAFVGHVVVLMHGFMMAVGEDGQAALGLSCQCSRSVFVIARGGRRGSLVRVRLWHGIQMLFLEGAGATGAVAATAVVRCINDQKLLL